MIQPFVKRTGRVAPLLPAPAVFLIRLALLLAVFFPALRVFFPALPVVWPALPVLAAEEAHGPTAMDLVYNGINLAVLLGVIFYFTRKPVARFFRTSAQDRKSGYDAAVQEAKETTAALEAQKTRISGLEAELNRMLENASADAAEEREQLSREAEAHGERIIAQARTQVEQEMNKARLALREQLADETVRLARELLSSRLDDERRAQLVTDYIEQLEAGR